MMPAPRPATLGERVLPWLLLFGALAAALWLVRRPTSASTHTRPRVDPIFAIPAGPMLLVSIDVQRLSAATAAELLQAGGKELLGLRELCGFEPLLALRHVVFAVPYAKQPQQASDFALVSDTSLQPEPVLRCAEALVRKRGGSPVRSRIGQFLSVRDQAKPLGEVAIRTDGLFVLSGGQYFRDVIDAASGQPTSADEAALLRSQLHRRIRGKLGPSQLLITLLPQGLLPLPGVQAVGLGVEVQSEALLRGFVGCRTAGDCGMARQVVDGLSVEMQNEAGLTGLATLKLTQHEQELELEARLPRAQLVPLLAQLATP